MLLQRRQRLWIGNFRRPQCDAVPKRKRHSNLPIAVQRDGDRYRRGWGYGHTTRERAAGTRRPRPARVYRRHAVLGCSRWCWVGLSRLRSLVWECSCRSCPWSEKARTYNSSSKRVSMLLCSTRSVTVTVEALNLHRHREEPICHPLNFPYSQRQRLVLWWRPAQHPQCPKPQMGPNSMRQTAFRVMACPEKAMALWHQHSMPRQRI